VPLEIKATLEVLVDHLSASTDVDDRRENWTDRSYSPMALEGHQADRGLQVRTFFTEGRRGIL
jgi:hypothetical protein